MSGDVSLVCNNNDSDFQSRSLATRIQTYPQNTTKIPSFRTKARVRRRHNSEQTLNKTDTVQTEATTCLVFRCRRRLLLIHNQTSTNDSWCNNRGSRTHLAFGIIKAYFEGQWPACSFFGNGFRCSESCIKCF